MAVGEHLYYDFFDFRVDLRNQQLLKNGAPVQLAPKTFGVLAMLVRDSGQTKKKEDIFEELWPDSFVEEGNLTQHIHVLRKVLGRTPGEQPYIETVPRQGYRFTLQPEQISITLAGPDAVAAEGPAGSSPLHVSVSNDVHSTTPDPMPGEELAAPDRYGRGPTDTAIVPVADQQEKKLPRFQLIAAVLVLLLGLTAAASAVYYFRIRKPTADGNVHSIAVLPFKHIGSELEGEKLGLGMADAVITQLSVLPQLEVRPTSSIIRYVDQPDVDSIMLGRQLGVDAVLEGTVQRDGDRVKVAVQLLRVADGGPLLAEAYYENASDIFVIQDLISKRIVGTLSLRLTPQQEAFLTNRGTNNPAAYQPYQLGIYFLNKRNKDDLLRAAAYFEQATRTDPGYAQAYAGLADAYSMLGYYRFAEVREMKDKARGAAEKALSLNDSIGEAFVALAVTYILEKEDLNKAQSLLERAIKVSPYNGSARHRYGWILLSNGKLNEGVEQIRLAVEYDPQSPATNRAYCSALVMQRRFADAVAQCESTMQIDGKTPNSGRALARAYFYNGRQGDAERQLENLVDSGAGTQYDVLSAQGELAYYYAKTGRSADAHALYTKLEGTVSKDRTRAFDLTLIAFALGDQNAALRYFKKMLPLLDQIPDSHLSLLYDPYWDEIKADPRFAPLFPN